MMAAHPETRPMALHLDYDLTDQIVRQAGTRTWEAAVASWCQVTQYRNGRPHSPTFVDVKTIPSPDALLVPPERINGLRWCADRPPAIGEKCRVMLAVATAYREMNLLENVANDYGRGLDRFRFPEVIRFVIEGEWDCLPADDSDTPIIVGGY